MGDWSLGNFCIGYAFENVDSAVLQYQNQRLLQQIDKQKHDLQDVEAKIKELKDKQVGCYGLILLGLCAGRSQNALQSLDGADYSRGSIPSCSAEEMFLCRLLQRDSIEANGNDEIAKCVEEALTLHLTSTRELLKLLEHTIYSHREKTESIVHTLDGKISSEGQRFNCKFIAMISSSYLRLMMDRVVKNLREAIDILHVKQLEYADVIRTYLSSQSTDQSEIRRITGELDDSMTELEESRRKLVNLKMQKDVASGMHNLTSGAVKGTHLKNQQKGQ
ncbi:unnamed protein product [Prunus armeniaca]|uniref:E3 ubiquitin protein ligase n=1 Tax=Prunus armeniaca TaxID=36596 RepID=A0A6J5TCR4_PRUAR|nr:unnamed protein product [Prunus armeniaca]